MKNYKYIFFGTPKFSEMVLEEMKQKGYLPSLLITAPDKPKGRKLILTPSDAKVWAQKNAIPVLEPPTLRDAVVQESLKEETWDFFVVASYGKILPKEILDIPEFGVLNIHPSLLPKLRGASPIQSSILLEKETGVTIMLMDELLDHGPILSQERLTDTTFPLPEQELEEKLAILGADLLCETIPKWVNAEISPLLQDHDKATLTKKITKEDGEINLEDDPEINYRKFLAFQKWPRVYFFTEKDGKKMRVIISNAEFKNNEFRPLKVIPEGRGEMTYDEFSKWNNN